MDPHPPQSLSPARCRQKLARLRLGARGLQRRLLRPLPSHTTPLSWTGTLGLKEATRSEPRWSAGGWCSACTPDCAAARWRSSRVSSSARCGVPTPVRGVRPACRRTASAAFSITHEETSRITTSATSSLVWTPPAGLGLDGVGSSGDPARGLFTSDLKSSIFRLTVQYSHIIIHFETREPLYIAGQVLRRVDTEPPVRLDIAPSY
jgi:hypothetical protein